MHIGRASFAFCRCSELGRGALTNPFQLGESLLYLSMLLSISVGAYCQAEVACPVREWASAGICIISVELLSNCGTCCWCLGQQSLLVLFVFGEFSTIDHVPIRGFVKCTTDSYSRGCDNCQQVLRPAAPLACLHMLLSFGTWFRPINHA
jgi:hypothetical protein